MITTRGNYHAREKNVLQAFPFNHSGICVDIAADVISFGQCDSKSVNGYCV